LTDYEINIKTYEVEYDLDNRIIKVDVDNNDVEYRYDALGRRVIRKEGSDKTALLWWGNSECAEYEHGAGQSCIQNDIMSHPSRLNSVIARAVDGSKFDLEWYHKNYLDHVYAVSDDSGNLDEHYRYTAFGEVTIYNGSGTIKTTSQINNQIMWNTRRLDTVSGYYLYKYRHYDPQLGRWPSRDPIEEKGGVNLYAFVGNDPKSKWDYLGLDSVIIIGSPSLSRDDPNGDGNRADRHDQNPWNFLNLGLRRAGDAVKPCWKDGQCCCKIIIIIYELGYTRRSAADGRGNLRGTVDGWRTGQGEASQCIEIKYVSSGNDLLDELRNLDEESVDDLEYLGHSSDTGLMPEYASNAGVNDGSVDANGDGVINGSDATSEDFISNENFIGAVSDRMSRYQSSFSHYGCYGAECARQFNRANRSTTTYGAEGRTNYNPAGGGGRPERTPGADRGVFTWGENSGT
jgi:RHS repeat-associated protein